MIPWNHSWNCPFAVVVWLTCVSWNQRTELEKNVLIWFFLINNDSWHLRGFGSLSTESLVRIRPLRNHLFKFIQIVIWFVRVLNIRKLCWNACDVKEDARTGSGGGGRSAVDGTVGSGGGQHVAAWWTFSKRSVSVSTCQYLRKTLVFLNDE